MNCPHYVHSHKVQTASGDDIAAIVVQLLIFYDCFIEFSARTPELCFH